MQDDRVQPEEGPDRPQLPPARGAGLRGLFSLLRSLPERFKRPESLLMFMAMFASLGAHMPPWLGLGALADYFSKQEAAEQRAAPIEVSFDVSDTKPVEEAPTMKDEDPSPKAKLDRAAKQTAKLEPEKPKPEPPKPPEKEVQVTKLEPDKVQPPPPPPPPPPPSEARRQSVTQKSEDPNVEPPPDAKFVAEESRRVEEETVASVTSPTRDDPVPEKSAPQAENEPEQAGDARKDERGEVSGGDQPNEAVVAQPSRTPPPPPTPEQSASAQRPSPAPAPSPRMPSAPSAPSIPEGTVIQDPLGSFVLAQPKRSSAPAAQQSGGGAVGASAANIKVSWRSFEETFGAEQLAKDRMPKGAKRRGAGREKRWNEFRAAIENYVVGVKPGNQTALNAAADPFAAYLAAFHRHLHMEFAHQFLESLPLTGKLGDPSLMAKVEIVVNPDGSLERVGIVKSSGDLMYDFGAFNAVQRGAPYPPPPEKIRSTDGRTYMRWALYRNESQCGTWNAEPFILKSPPRSPSDPKQDNVSPYQQRPSGDGEHGRAPAEPAHVPSDSGKAPGETLGLAPDSRKLGLLARR